MGVLESEVLALLWKAGRALSVREVLDGLNRSRHNPLAYTTVMTVLSRMADKGAVARERVGRGYQYSPVVADKAALAVRQIIDEHGAAAVAHFLDHAEADEDLRRRLQQIVDRRSDLGPA